MSNYDLDRLGDQEFEHLVQALLKKIIGAGTTTFGDGPDGGREATYTGSAQYPSQTENWSGNWIFQAKFHNTRLIGPDKARKQVLSDLRSELDKIVNKYGRSCDNYILATNVPLTSVPELGAHDKIAQTIVPDFLDRIPNIQVWGYDDIARFLDGSPEIRQTYLHLITPGDLIAELMDRSKAKKSSLAEAVLLYVRTSFEREQYAQLDQAGEIGERPMPLRRVFIDLNVKPRSEKDLIAVSGLRPEIADRAAQLMSRETASAVGSIISSDLPKIVLIGGPGQGKSTLGQFVAQIQRANILHRTYELNGGKQKFVPSIVRLPLRIILKDYAQWIVDSTGSHAVEEFLTALVAERAGRQITTEQFQEIIKSNPTLLILDGLDEVIDRHLRTRMLELLSEFIGRCEDVLNADLQIVATSRPTGYSDQFDPTRFLHLSLLPMNSERVLEYTERWIIAKELESAKASLLRASIKECLSDSHFSSLMNTPLQVTIFVLIILSGGTPPRQREELFDEYLEVIYKRERAKSKTIIQTEKRLLFGLHQYLAYVLHKNAAQSSDTRSKMKEEEFAKEVFRYLRHEDPYSPASELQQKADQMITEARRRLVLLVEFDDGSFGFDLRSIQEFFAAGWLTDRAAGDKQRFERFRAIAFPSHWRNVALFFAGRIGRSFPGEAAQVLEACREIDRHKPDVFLKRGAWLASEIVVDRSFGPNRILQRSAIEYVLTLLDGDLDSRKRNELASRLLRLPAEDFADHLMPLLIERVQRASLPAEFSTLDLTRSLSIDRTPLEEKLSLALTQGVTSPLKVVEKAIELRLRPEYVSTLSAVFSKIDTDQLSDLFLDSFKTDPEYVAQIAGDNLNEGMREIFYAALESDYTVDRWFDPTVPSAEKLAGINAMRTSDQLARAWELALNVRIAFDRPPALKNFPTKYLDSFLNSFYGRSTKIHHHVDDVREIVQIANSKDNEVELRAVAAAFLSKALSSGSSDVLRRGLLEWFRRWSATDLESTERIFFSLRSSSAGNTEPKVIFEFPLKFTSEKMESAIAAAFVVDSLQPSHFDSIVKEAFGRLELIKGVPNDVARTAARRMGSTVPLRRQSLPQPFVIQVLAVVVDLLKEDNSRTQWRPWAALKRLTSFGWDSGRPKLFRGNDKLNRVVMDLCEVLENKTIAGRWELGSLLINLATIEGQEANVVRVMRIIGRMGEGKYSDRSSRFGSGLSLQKGTMHRLSRVAAKADEEAFSGFLRWFAVVSASRVALHPDSESFIYLRANPDRTMAVLHHAKGSLREGAIRMLANQSFHNDEQILGILDYSRGDTKPIDRAWADFVKNTIADSNTSLLETILADHKGYPNGVRYAAMEKYQRLTAATNIADQEHLLGLPFQDN